MSDKKGKVTQVIGPVVDVQYEGDLPDILDGLIIDNNGEKLTLEVAQHLGEKTVRAIAMSSTDGLVRGQEVIATGEPISVPVGPEMLGKKQTLKLKSFIQFIDLRLYIQINLQNRKF